MAVYLIKNLPDSKGNSMKRQPKECMKIFANHFLIKELISKYIRNSFKAQ